MTRPDAVSGSLLFGLGMLVTFQSRTLDYLDEFGPGPGFLPYWLGLLMTLLGLCLAISGLRNRKETAGPSFTRGGLGRAMLAASGLASMVALLDILGFILSIALLAFFLNYIVERRPLAGAITVSAAITLGFFLLFRIFLPVSLPAGLWGF
jgi:hypothetical protein